MKVDNKKFLYNEKISGILDWKVEDVTIWRYERFTAHRFLSELNSRGTSRTEVSREYESKKLTAFVKLFLGYKLRPQKKYQVLILDHPRRVFKAGKYVCKYTEMISENYKDSIMYEVPFNDGHMEPARTENLLYLDRILIRSYIYEVFMRVLWKKRYRRAYALIEEALKKVFKEEYEDKTYCDLAKSMTKNLFLIKYRKKHYKKLINKISPQVIIEVVGYSRNNMIINEIAKELGIPTIELQHSQVNDELIQYMWGERKDVEQFPDYFFSFGSFWSLGLELPIPEDNIKAVGFPYFEEEIQGSMEKEKNEELDSDFVFISQYLAGESVYKLAMEYADMNPDVKIIYKLHPEEYDIWEERYPRLKEYSSIKVITDVKITLYDCFANTRAVVGVFSGALYEALAFNLPVYLYKAEYIEYMQKLIDVKGAIVIESASELAGYVKSGIKASVPDMEIWKADALNNMVREINRILEKGNDI